MGLTTLESEVYVLGTIPVKYIFTLSALDSKQHLNAMTQFITLIESKDFFRELENMNVRKQFINGLQRFYVLLLYKFFRKYCKSYRIKQILFGLY